jgi:hypothetical protein
LWADAKERNVYVLESRQTVAKAARFLCSAGRVIGRIKIQDVTFAFVIDRSYFSMNGVQFELGCFVSYFQHIAINVCIFDKNKSVWRWQQAFLLVFS